jgi:gliding motility-associated-like protein/uncharacterized delta-60 repeat protein
MKNIILLLVLLISTFIFAQPGSLDVTFNVGTGTNSYILTTLIQKDGKIFIGGAFSSYNGTTSNGIARINPDGSIDTSFNIGTGIPWIVTSSALQLDGKIIIGGHFETFNGVSRNKIVRLNTDGSLDLTFNPGTGVYGTINDVSLQPDGKIIIAGNFTSFNGVARQGIARLNADGSLDLGFNSGLEDSNIYTLSLQSDGKIIIGGYFTNYNNVPRKNIARLNSDGSLDTSFDLGEGANDVVITSVIQTDGKIIIGGAFSQFNNTATNHIARLNIDGSLDTSFSTGAGTGLGYYSSVIVHKIALQMDGKIFVGGEFWSYNGITRNYLTRLNVNGSLETVFDPATGPDRQVRTISIQEDNKIIIGGGFFKYDNRSSQFIARLNNDILTPIASAQIFCGSATVADLTASGTNLKWYTTETGGMPLVPTTTLTSTTYHVSQTVEGVESARTAVAVTINTPVTPTFTQPSDSCPGSTLQPLPTISNNRISGSWSPPLDNTISTTYTFTPTAGSCATTASLTLTIKSGITPFFTQVAPICSGDIIPTLPTISNNNISGSWSPTLNNIATTTYTFTPSNGSCANITSMTITVNPYTTPTFTQLAPICSGEIITALPTISNNGISGIWSPALDNTKTTEYTFTPSTAVGSCINTTKITVTVNPIITPTFTQVGPICSGSIINALPTTSNNGITGFWSPIIDNANTKTYTFTPTSGVCAATTSMTIIVNPTVIPTFTAIAPICSGDIIPALPIISNNNISGSWSPTLNNTATTTYTFTPTTGVCATIVQMIIEVLPTPNIELNHDEIICSGNNELVQLNAGLLSGAQSQYNYQWSRNGLALPLETGYYLDVNQEGTYTCLVTDKTSTCTRTRTNTVIYSKKVSIEKVLISDLSVNNTVTVLASVLDNTEYSLDNPNGPFQISNTFENVESGFHTVYVNDKNGCGTISQIVAVVGVPLYFTPNDDGFNDYWKVKGINGQFFKNSKVIIYDRYGKVLTVLPNAENEGWDGTYNGYPLPASDYWFVIDLEDGRSAKGHFSLKR